MKICYPVTMTNHQHLLYLPDSPEQASDFFRLVNAQTPWVIDTCMVIDVLVRRVPGEEGARHFYKSDTSTNRKPDEGIRPWDSDAFYFSFF